MFFVHRAVEKLDLQEFAAGYSDEGHPAYHPALLLKVWLYAYALAMTGSRTWSSASGKIWRFAIWRAGAAGLLGAERVSQAPCTCHE